MPQLRWPVLPPGRRELDMMAERAHKFTRVLASMALVCGVGTFSTAVASASAAKEALAFNFKAIGPAKATGEDPQPGQGVGRHIPHRPQRPLVVRLQQGQGDQKRLHRYVRHLLAGLDRQRDVDSRRRHQEIRGGQGQRAECQPGDLLRPPALLLRRRYGSGPDHWDEDRWLAPVGAVRQRDAPEGLAGKRIYAGPEASLRKGRSTRPQRRRRRPSRARSGLPAANASMPRVVRESGRRVRRCTHRCHVPQSQSVAAVVVPVLG